MTKAELSAVYEHYVSCLNAQDWNSLGRFVATHVEHNGRELGLSGYREMLERDFMEIPDLRFNIDLLVVDPPYIATRLSFNCTPSAQFLGLAVDGRKVSFAENVFYEFKHAKIARVWSILDKVAIEVQLRGGGGEKADA